MTVSAIVANDGAVTSYDDPVTARDASGTTWVRATEATDEEIAAVATAFDLHPLAIDDLRGDVRPKTEPFREYTFILFETAELTTEETAFADEVITEPVGIFVGEDWLVTLSGARTGRPTGSGARSRTAMLDSSLAARISWPVG